MGTLKKTSTGKIDKRTKEYKDLVERAKKARTAKLATNKSASASAGGAKRRADGKLDLRTKEGKATAERMAKARAARGGLLKRLFK